MDKFSADKLDNLFKEQFSEMEIALEEDYWPGIEKGLSKLSFYRFGWKHLNIYNISSAALLLFITSFLLLSNKEHKGIQKANAPALENNTTVIFDNKNSESTFTNPEPSKTIETENSKKETDDKSIVDSVIPPAKEFVQPVITTPEPEKVVVEEKPKQKPKKIIYVVQQDTIIQKDTVKVRRKKKN